ncbi:hypothetical protein ACFV1B_23250 [Streptomyces sp. NPDC059637]|uniref:hypothetical protein n=1 Tax=Streptomyces sp. NPDC059637 TaxID=3347752 RepID=UPI0036B2A44D
MDILLILIATTMIVGAVATLRRGRGHGKRQTLQEYGDTVAARHGFVPAERLDVRLPGPDPELDEALEEMGRTGQWQPAARLLALTGDDWELRWQRVHSLAGAARVELVRAPGEGGRWLRTWRLEAPEEPGGAVVHALFLAHQAAGSAAGPGSHEHRIILEEARSACAQAALLAPGDPTPLVAELVVACYAGDRRADVESLWGRITALAPHHMGAHLAALPHWGEKGHGSRAEAHAFAERAAASAPGGSLLPALPLFAVFANLPDVDLGGSLFRGAVVGTAVEGALYAVRSAPADHPVMPHVRHLLAWFLVKAERHGEALEQFRLVDGHVGALPWTTVDDPAEAYAAHRMLAAVGWERSGGKPVGA